MFSYVKRAGAQRFLSSSAVSAFKSERLFQGKEGDNDDDVDGIDVNRAAPVVVVPKGPILRQDEIWRTDGAAFMGFGSAAAAAQSSSHPHFQLFHPLQPQPPLLEMGTQYPHYPTTNLPPISLTVPSTTTVNEDYDQPAINMEAFLQELSMSDDSPTGSMDQATSDYGSLVSSPLSPVHGQGNGAAFAFDHLWFPWSNNNGGGVESNRATHQFRSASFDEVHQSVAAMLCMLCTVPDMTMFHLFRKVDTQPQAEQAVAALMKDRELRSCQGMPTPYSEATSAVIFNALNRIGGEDFVVAAAEKASDLGLTLSRSNVYHLMKQYSVQGKVDHVEKLFRALEFSGKSWNSNCIVIMMLAYFNQGKFEQADKLRNELKSRGIKISERIETRLDKLLAGEEKWRWEDQVFSRTNKKKSSVLSPPPGFPTRDGSIMVSRGGHHHQEQQQQNWCMSSKHGIHTTACSAEADATAETEEHRVLTPPTMMDAVREPRIHLNILRAAAYIDLYKTLMEFIDIYGPVENVCISFLFRKVDTKEEAESAMVFLDKERAARRIAGISADYNETTCSRIFSALFKTGVPDLAYAYAENAQERGLTLSGKALHELLKSFATRNEVEKVEQIWKLVKMNQKPSSRIVYSIFRTYFDNGMMDRAKEFCKEINAIGIKLSASATRNIEEVLSGNKRWVKDPHFEEC